MQYGLYAVLYGVLMSIQTALCAGLTMVYGNWFSAVTVHLTGLIALTPFFLGKWGKKQGNAQWYWYLGGGIGAVNVVITNYAILAIGMTYCNVLMLLGEILFALVSDSFGLMGSLKQRVKPMKLLAVAVMILGCWTPAWLSGTKGVTFSLLAVVFSLLRGVTLVISRQLNGQLGVRCGKGYSTWMNYATGFAASLLIFGILGFPMETAFPAALPVWAYLGGVFGCLGIFLCNTASPKLSALTMSLLVFVSETVTGMVFDGLRGMLSAATVTGCIIVSLGMVLNLHSERDI